MLTCRIFSCNIVPYMNIHVSLLPAAALHNCHVKDFILYNIATVSYPLPHPPSMRRHASAEHPCASDNASLAPPMHTARQKSAKVACPALRYSPDAVCHTHGSKVGSSITAAWVAWVHPEARTQHALSLPAPEVSHLKVSSVASSLLFMRLCTCRMLISNWTFLCTS